MIAMRRITVGPHDCTACGLRFFPAVRPDGLIDLACPQCGSTPNNYDQD